MNEDRERRRAAITARLRRIEGQARGVQNMISEGRNCEEVVIQLASMRSAVNRAALAVVSGYFEECIRAQDDLEVVLERVKKLFLNIC